MEHPLNANIICRKCVSEYIPLAKNIKEKEKRNHLLVNFYFCEIWEFFGLINKKKNHQCGLLRKICEISTMYITKVYIYISFNESSQIVSRYTISNMYN